MADITSIYGNPIKDATARQDIRDLKEDYHDIDDRVTTLEQGGSGSGLTADIKTALLNCFENVAWKDDDPTGRTFINALENALYAITAITLNTNSIALQSIGATAQLTATTTPEGGNVTWSSSNTSVATVSSTGLVTSVAYGSATITATAGSVSATCSVVVAQATLTSISTVYTQSGTVYDTDALDTLKDDLVVTAHWSNGTTSTVASADYTLSGTLTAGTSTITVSYGDKTTTFTVTVTEPEWGSDYTWLYKASDGVLLSARTDIVTPTNSGATETLNNGSLNLFAPHVVSGQSKNIRYDLVDTTTTSGKLSAKIRFNEIDVSSTAKAYGFRLQLSNGTNGIMFYEWYNGTTLKLLTYVNNTLTQLVSLDFDTWYIIAIEINNGTYTIKVNGDSVHTSTTPATYYCTANRIQMQNSGGTTASATDNDVDVEWIAYKAND